ncbi:hypothetical protein MWN34_06325 [Ancylobacter sp. 6x-1]|uniref:Uncharacterized protein n=1 Tax=Ancylobacter crimeensis TaxID=2579147 RepID=A0ABT0D998_9HYPH|nr:hypothetical protein [Ancylobacter crimeensis]MCK0196526.1 hypothetical protein [Ancylobacter crimeensis]
MKDELNGHKGNDGTFSDDKDRGKEAGAKDEGKKSPKSVPAGNPTNSGEQTKPVGSSR